MVGAAACFGQCSTTMGRQCSATGNAAASDVATVLHTPCLLRLAITQLRATSHTPWTPPCTPGLGPACPPIARLLAPWSQASTDAAWQLGTTHCPGAATPLSMKPRHPLPPTGSAANSKTSPPRPAAHSSHTSNNHQGTGAPCASAHSSSSWWPHSTARSTNCWSQGQGGSWARSHCSMPR